MPFALQSGPIADRRRPAARARPGRRGHRHGSYRLHRPCDRAGREPMTTTTSSTRTRTGLSLTDVTLTFGDGDDQVAALDHVDLTVAPGRADRDRRTLRRRQVQPPGRRRRPDPAHLRVGRRGRHRPDRAVTARAGGASAATTSASCSSPATWCPPSRPLDQLRLVEKITGRRAATPPLELLRAVGMEKHAGRRPGASPVVSASASGSPGRLSPRRRCSWSTSPRPPWTGAAATRSSRCSRTRRTSSQSRPSWSPTTTTCSSTATASWRWSTAAPAGLTRRRPAPGGDRTPGSAQPLSTSRRYASRRDAAAA